MRRSAYVGAMLAALLVSAGCASTAVTATTPSAQTSAASAAPASPSADSNAGQSSPPAEETASSWVLSDEGAGPLRLSTPIDTALAALPEAEHACHDWAWRVPSVDPAQALWITQTDGLLSHIESSMPDGPRTADGLGVGSTRDEVLAVYPDAEFVPRNIAWLQSGNLIFGFREGISYGDVVTDERSGSDLVVAVGATTIGPLYEFCG